jgi:hypothetical protein
MSQQIDIKELESILDSIKFSPDQNFNQSLWQHLLTVADDVGLLSSSNSPPEDTRRKFPASLKNGNLNFRYRKVIIFGVTLLFVLVVCACVPNLRAALKKLVNIVLYDSPRIGDTTIAQPDIGYSEPLPLIGIDEAQRQVPIPIPQPAWLPEDISLLGVYLYREDEDSDDLSPDESVSFGLSLLYGYENNLEKSKTARFKLTIISGIEYVGALVPEQYVEEIQAAGKVIYDVKGSWENTSDGSLEWDPSIDIITASWTDANVSFDLRVIDMSLDQETVLKIIKSIQ